jgi:hypothetical protein
MVYNSRVTNSGLPERAAQVKDSRYARTTGINIKVVRDVFTRSISKIALMNAYQD